jgi:hypothetical protein
MNKDVRQRAKKGDDMASEQMTLRQVLLSLLGWTVIIGGLFTAYRCSGCTFENWSPLRRSTIERYSNGKVRCGEVYSRDPDNHAKICFDEEGRMLSSPDGPNGHDDLLRRSMSNERSLR